MSVAQRLKAPKAENGKLKRMLAKSIQEVDALCEEHEAGIQAW